MPKVFVSWSNADRRTKPLAQLLERWVTDLFHGRLEVFISVNIEGGAEWSNELLEQLNGADFGFILVSQRTGRSPWVLFESGALNRLREKRLIPLLFDDYPIDLDDICPPLARFQAVSLLDYPDVLRLTLQVAEALGMSTTERDELEKVVSARYPALQDGIRGASADHPTLPDRFAGTTRYNPNIGGSNNFQMPAIFSHFERELFLVGINLNLLLNLPTNDSCFRELLDRLLEKPGRHVRLLVADLWDDPIRYTYDKVIGGKANFELPTWFEVFDNQDSTFYLDTFIRRHVGEPGYAQVSKQLSIKKIGMLMDTFWFVDADPAAKTGDMLLMLMTSDLGRNRPVFYANHGEQPELFRAYYDMCRGGFDATRHWLWPRRT